MAAGMGLKERIGGQVNGAGHKFQRLAWHVRRKELHWLTFMDIEQCFD